MKSDSFPPARKMLGLQSWSQIEKSSKVDFPISGRVISSPESFRALRSFLNSLEYCERRS
jgi:hypothetical protein